MSQAQRSASGGRRTRSGGQRAQPHSAIRRQRAAHGRRRRCHVRRRPTGHHDVHDGERRREWAPSSSATRPGCPSKLGSFSRRELEWTFQSNMAEGEINQVMKQLRGAQIREAIAQKEYENHQVQMQQAADIENFLKGSQVSDRRPGRLSKDHHGGLLSLDERRAAGPLLELLPAGVLSRQEGGAGVAERARR